MPAKHLAPLSDLLTRQTLEPGHLDVRYLITLLEAGELALQVDASGFPVLDERWADWDGAGARTSSVITSAS